MEFEAAGMRCMEKLGCKDSNVALFAQHCASSEVSHTDTHTHPWDTEQRVTHCIAASGKSQRLVKPERVGVALHMMKWGGGVHGSPPPQYN